MVKRQVPDEFPWMASLCNWEIFRKVGPSYKRKIREWNTDTLVGLLKKAGIQICNNAPRRYRRRRNDIPSKLRQQSCRQIRRHCLNQAEKRILSTQVTSSIYIPCVAVMYVPGFCSTDGSYLADGYFSPVASIPIPNQQFLVYKAGTT
ncbi:hypothetical protein NQ317_002495 [Molorchus minor]|uniref:Transposase n=1 Tax=Molorchus minor TaxID=1323400 RepID=A0ABQ9J9E5_9CUCU|nr:hypothetical protein NQ317_002495 [Molorchus minor]